MWFLRNIAHAFSASALQSVRGQVFLAQYHRTLEHKAEAGAHPAQPAVCAEAVTMPAVLWSFRKKTAWLISGTAFEPNRDLHRSLVDTLNK